MSTRVRIARISRLHAGSARFGWQLGMHGQLGTVCVYQCSTKHCRLAV